MLEARLEREMMAFKCMVFVAVVVASHVFVAGTRCPDIITRKEWEAREDTTTEALDTHPPTYVLIHHSGTPSCITQEDCSALVKSMQGYHMRINRWNDIGYNFLVGEDGNVYEGVGWNRSASHAAGYNAKSLGICIIGDYTSRLPNDAAMKAVEDLIECGVSIGEISENYRIMGHRQVETKYCPGMKLYQEIRRGTHWAPY